MRAICVTPARSLILRQIPPPSTPPPGYINVHITAATINHGDKTFLKLPASASLTTGTRLHDVWGASASGIVSHIGPDVPSRYLNRKVAIYRGLKPNDDVLGMWSEVAQVPWETALILPDGVDEREYSGSLVNVVTAYAFLDMVVREGHTGVIVTAGGSATGRALVALAKRRGLKVLVIVRSEKAREEVRNEVKKENVLISSDPNFLQDLEVKARELGTTAVFDGGGGSSMSRMLPVLPFGSSVYFYGFLSGTEKVEFSSALFMMKNLTMKRFSNFDSDTVKERLGDMLRDLEGCIEDPVFRTSVGKEFSLEEIEEAMKYEGAKKKAVLVFSE